MRVRIHRSRAFSGLEQLIAYTCLFNLLVLGCVCFYQYLVHIATRDTSLLEPSLLVSAAVISIVAAAMVFKSICNIYIIKRIAKQVDSQHVTINDVSREWCGYCYRYVVIFLLEKDNQTIRIKGELIGVQHDEMPRPGDDMIITTKLLKQPDDTEASRYEWSIPHFNQ